MQSPETKPVSIWRRFIPPFLLVLALFVALWVRAPSQQSPTTPSETQWGQVKQVSGKAFGTTYMVKWVYHAQEADEVAVRAAVERVVESINKSMSTYHKDSELSLFNQSKSLEAVNISVELMKVLQEAERIRNLTDGAFDVTIGPVINAWGFGPMEVLEPPADEVLKQAWARVGSQHIELNPGVGTILKKIPDVYVDLSAIAKGYAVDQVAKALDNLGFSRYLVEIGGELRGRGQGPEKAWTVGIEHPKPKDGTREVYETLPLTDLSMATSGNYRNYVLKGGKRVTHIIDARNGQPVSHGLGSVSVLHRECMSADALATALYVLGYQEGMALAEEEHWAVLFLIPQNDGTIVRHASSAYKALKSSNTTNK